jgi:hypothetical protein
MQGKTDEPMAIRDSFFPPAEHNRYILWLGTAFQLYLLFPGRSLLITIQHDNIVNRSIPLYSNLNLTMSLQSRK